MPVVRSLASSDPTRVLIQKPPPPPRKMPNNAGGGVTPYHLRKSWLLAESLLLQTGQKQKELIADAHEENPFATCTHLHSYKDSDRK